MQKRAVLVVSVFLVFVAALAAVSQRIPQTFGQVPPLAAVGTTSGSVSYLGMVMHRGQIPFNWHSQTTPYQSGIWLSGNYFAIGGTCSPAVPSTGTYDAVAMAKYSSQANNVNVQGGLYLFKGDGTFLKTENVCYDGDIPGPSAPASGVVCNEGRGCEISDNMFPVSATTFVREMVGTSFNRPPLEFGVNGGTLSLLAKPYTGTRTPGFSATPEYTSLVPVGGKILAVNTTGDGSGNYQLTNVLLSASLAPLREWSVPYAGPVPGTPGVSGRAPATEPEIVPAAGVGNYVIGRSGAGLDSSAVVYHLKPDNTFEKVSSLPGFAQSYSAPLYDPSNPNVMAFLNNTNNPSIDFYQASDSGLTKTKSVNLPESGARITGASIMGDYIVYGSCPASNWSVIPVTSNTADPYKGCRGVILKGGQVSGQFTLPQHNGGVTEDPADPLLDDLILMTVLSPNGDLLVGSQWGYLYHYKVGGTPGAGGPGQNASTTPGVGDLPGSTFSIVYNPNPGTSQVLIRYASIVSVSDPNLTIKIFGRTYTVDASAARILNYSWAPTTLANINEGYVNVYGTLDTADPTLIHAQTVRDPIPGGGTGNGGGGGGGSGTPAAASTAATAAIQSKLNALLQALKALQARVSQ